MIRLASTIVENSLWDARHYYGPQREAGKKSVACVEKEIPRIDGRRKILEYNGSYAL